MTQLPPDGIGCTPYTIDVNNTDRYPLMGMFSDFNATSKYHVQTICNSTISDFQFNGTAISFNVSGEDDTIGFCRILVPKALMNEPYRILVNGKEVFYYLLQFSNETHSLYFTYNHSTKEVTIIPECLTCMPILLLLIVFTVAIVLYKRRLLKTPIH